VTTLADWTPIRSPVEAAVLAEMLLTAPRKEDHSTATGEAVLFAVAEMKRAPGCQRQVIDVSSDGRVNAGTLMEDAVAMARANGVMVNALVIEEPTEPGLLDYYRDAVNGFALPATWDTYAQSLKMKMTLEIANAPRRVEPDFAVVGYAPPYAVLHGGAVGGVHDRAPSWLVEVRTGRLPDASVNSPDAAATLVAGLALLGCACLARR